MRLLAPSHSQAAQDATLLFMIGDPAVSKLTAQSLLSKMVDVLEADLFVHSSRILELLRDSTARFRKAARLHASSGILDVEASLDDLSCSDEQRDDWRKVISNKPNTNAWGWGVESQQGYNLNDSHTFMGGRLIEEAERRRGEPHDTIAIVHADYYFLAPHAPLSMLMVDNHQSYVPCMKSDFEGLCDHYVIGNRDVIMTYRYVSPNCDDVGARPCYTKLYKGNPECCLNTFLERVEISCRAYSDTAFRACLVIGEHVAVMLRVLLQTRMANPSALGRRNSSGCEGGLDFDETWLFSNWIYRCGWHPSLIGKRNFSRRRKVVNEDNKFGTCNAVPGTSHKITW